MNWKRITATFLFIIIIYLFLSKLNEENTMSWDIVELNEIKLDKIEKSDTIEPWL